LLLQATARYGLELTASYLIGDRWRDIEGRASRRIDYSLDWQELREKNPSQPPDSPRDVVRRSCALHPGRGSRWKNINKILKSPLNKKISVVPRQNGGCQN
jgi:hypothetical protein